MPTPEEIIEVLKKIDDPEIFIDIWTLGLIYDIAIEGDVVNIRMTFTTPGCPAGPYLVDEVKMHVCELGEGVVCNVEIVFDPPWTASAELKALLGIDY